MEYSAPSNFKVFAASATEIFDVTSPGSPTVPPAAAVSGRTTGYYSYVNFATSGGNFLTAVNGSDPLLLYDTVGGWVPITGVSSPAITGISTSALSYVWNYRNRQFFIEGSTLRAWYLPVNSIAGAANVIDLNGVFQRGGKLLFGATWSMNAGNGLDDKCVFVTDQGEVAVYQGFNPGDANNWGLVGRYDMTSPMGSRAFCRVGGDLLIGVKDGIVPISSAVSKDPAALSLAAVTRAVTPDWKREVIARSTHPWEIVKWPEKSMLVISMPSSSAGQDHIAYVANVETGAWCRFVGMNIRCTVLSNGRLFFGTSDGKVKEAEIGGTDDGAGIYYTIIGNPEYLGNRAAVKTLLQARATYIGSTPFVDKISVSTDYKINLPTAPNAAPDVSLSEWDAGLWDVALWDGEARSSSVRAKWVSIGRTGYAFQYQVQVTGGLTPAPDNEFISLDLLYETGGIVV
ncbi:MULTISPECIES: hypothetical protein [unclassified Mesorhizobium]|uniref:hypothetical protein n=1 Tax=unclassified Mesorhizobium TaxID=325217 RepID=UPI0030141FEB